MDRTITICGSMDFIDEMEALSNDLSGMGFRVFIPERSDPDFKWHELSEQETIDTKRKYIDQHIEKIKIADVLLIANFEKNDILGYVGSNSLIEASFGYLLSVPVLFLFPIGPQPCRLEAQCLAKGILSGDVDELADIFSF